VPTLRPRALLFDMDGLMVDSEPLWHEVECEVARRHGGAWTEALSHECIGTGLPHSVELMRERLGLALATEAGVGELCATFIARVSELALKPGCRELLDAAHGRLPLALASSSTSELVDAVLARFELAGHFAAVVSGSSVARPKPAPDIFLCAAERLGVPASACVVLEDSAAGVAAGRAAGMVVIAVPERERRRFASLADHVVGDLHEARALLAL
jgi:mannitol-1-/sugar-/sorbitol-6-/2-deoxyglucose-6-phosphatase